MKNNNLRMGSTPQLPIHSALMQAHDPESIRENSADLFVKSNGKHYICSVFYTCQVSSLAKLAGVFYAYIYTNFGFVPPCGALMRPLPDKVEDNGKGETVFIFAY